MSEKTVEQKIDKTNIDKETLEIIKNATKSSDIVNQISIEKLNAEIKEHLEFLDELNTVDITANEYRVIITLGETELIYDNGEFYLCDTKSVYGKRKKLSKKEAKDICRILH